MAAVAASQAITPPSPPSAASAIFPPQPLLSPDTDIKLAKQLVDHLAVESSALLSADEEFAKMLQVMVNVTASYFCSGSGV